MSAALACVTDRTASAPNAATPVPINLPRFMFSPLLAWIARFVCYANLTVLVTREDAALKVVIEFQHTFQLQLCPESPKTAGTPRPGCAKSGAVKGTGTIPPAPVRHGCAICARMIPLRGVKLFPAICGKITAGEKQPFTLE